MTDGQDSATAVLENGSGRGPATILLAELPGLARTAGALGPSAGEAIRDEVERRLAETAPEAASAGRIGADEYALVLRGLPAPEARDLSRRVRSALREEIRVPGGSVRYRVAVGVLVRGGAGGARPADDEVELARRALEAARSSEDGVHVLEAGSR